MKNILSYLLMLPLLLLYSNMNAQADHHQCTGHTAEHHQKLIFQNEDYKALFTNKYLIQNAEDLPLSSDLGNLDLSTKPAISVTFENFQDMIQYLDEADADHIEGLYSTGLLGFKDQLIDKVSNYLTIDRIPSPHHPEAFQLNIELQTIKEKSVLAKTTITYRQIGGLNFTSMERLASKPVIKALDLSGKKFRVYPVPTTDRLVIKGKASPTQIELIDIQGRIVMKQEDVDVRKRQLNVAHLPTGQYFLRIIDKRAEHIEIHKIIKL